MAKRRHRKRSYRRHLIEQLESRHLLAANPFGTNPLQPLDVNRDGSVSALDALRVINALGRSTSSQADPAANIGNFIDVSADGQGTALDALRVINALARNAPLLAAAFPNDSAASNRTDLEFDLITNDYAFDLGVSVGELGSRSVMIRIGETNPFVDITDQFIAGKASLTAAKIDAVFGRPLPDGDHPIEIRIDDVGSRISFVLTVDREAPTLNLQSDKLLRVAPRELNATFSEPVIRESLSGNLPTVRQIGVGVLEVVNGIVQGQTVVLPFSSTLPDGDFEFSFDGEAEDAAGNIASPLTFAFTVADPTGVADVSPRPGESGVRTTRNVHIDFDEPVDPSTVDEQSIQIISLGNSLPGTIRLSADRTRVTYTLDSDLPQSTAVRVIVDGERLRGRDGFAVDVDGDDEPGGIQQIDFRTTGVFPIPGTQVSGFIYDATRSTATTKVPIVGLTLRVEGLPDVTATTDANGFFTLVDVPAPEFFVKLDTSTVTNAPEGFFYAGPEKPFHSVAGQAVSLNHHGEAFDIYLPLVKADEATSIVAGEMTTAKFGESALAHLAEIMPNVPASVWQENFKVEIPPDSLFFEDGRPAEEIRIFALDKSQIPAPLPEQIDADMVFSIEAGGASQFDAPSKITFPNLEGLAPGEQRPLFSFDHDLGEWVLTGQATVSADGSVLETDEGGVNTLGWKVLGLNISQVFNGVGRYLAGNGFLIFETILTAHDFALSSARIAAPIAAGFVGLFAGAAACGPPCAVLGATIAFSAAENAVSKVAIKTEAVTAGVRGILQAAAQGGAASEIAKNAATNAVSNFEEVLISKALESKGGPFLTYANAIRNHGDIAESLGTNLGTLINRARAKAENSQPLGAEGESTGQIIGAMLLDLIHESLDWPLPTEEDRNAANELFVRYQQLPPDQLQFFQMAAKAAEALVTMEEVLSKSTLSEIDLLRLSDALEQFTENAGVFEMPADAVSLDVRTAAATLNDVQVQLSTSTLEPANGREIYYAYEIGDIVFRGSANEQTLRNYFPADQSILISIFDSSTGLAGSGFFYSSVSKGLLPNNEFSIAIADDTPDSDLDNLSDLAEFVLGTNAQVADTDQDGILDGVEILQGLNPLDGISAPSGIVASLSALNGASDIIVAASPNHDVLSAYVASNKGDLFIADVTNSTEPILIGEARLPGRLSAVAHSSEANIAFVAAGNSGLHFVDVSDPMLPKLVRTITDYGFVTEVEMVDGVVAVAAESLVLLDPRTGDLLETIELPNQEGRITDVFQSGDTLFAISGNSRLHSIDIGSGISQVLDDVLIPVPPSRLLTPDDMRLFVADGVAYISNGLEVEFVAATRPLERGGYVTFDVSDPSNLSLISNIDTGDFQAGNLQTVLNGSGLALVAGGFRGLQVHDASDPENTFNLIREFPTPGSAEAVAVVGGIAFVAVGPAGLQVISYRDFDALGIAPTVSIDTSAADLDPVTAGLQVQEGKSVRILPRITDDVQVRSAELLVNGSVVKSDLSFPFDFVTSLPNLNTGVTSIDLQVRATDTGGNSSLSNTISIQIVADTVAPTVVAVSPPAEATRIEGLQTISVSFSEEMDLAGLPTNAITLTRGSTNEIIEPAQVIGRLSDRQAIVTFPPLEVDAYMLKVSSLATDRAGNPVSIDFTSPFEILKNEDPGSDFATAFNLRELVGTLEIDESIGIADLNGVADPVDAYRFVVSDYRRFSLELSGRTDGANAFLVRDLNGNGTFDVGESWQQVRTATANDVNFSTDLIPGEYFVLIEPNSANDATQYRLKLSTSENGNGPLTLESGETMSGSISELGEYDFFTFDAVANQTLFLVVNESGGSGFNPGVFIYAPDGSLFDSVDSFTSGVSSSNQLLTQTGTYIIVVRDSLGDVIGPYDLTAVIVDTNVDADNLVLTSGQTVTGELAAGDIDTFTIEAGADDELFLVVSENGGSGFNPGVYIYAPDGTLFNSIERFTDGVSFSNQSLTQTGTYTIVVHDSAGDVVGSYDLTAVIVDQNVDADNVALTSGQTVTGELAAGDIDTFTIEAGADDELFLVVSENGGSGFNPGVYIYAPDGTLFNSIERFTDGVSFSNQSLTQTGTYTIVVHDSAGDVVGSYDLTAVIVDQNVDADNVALTSGQAVTGELAAGDIDTFTIDLMAGDAFSLVISESGGSGFNPAIYFYSPTGTLIKSVNSFTSSFSFSELIPLTGLYSIVLHDLIGDVIGEYDLTATIQ